MNVCLRIPYEPRVLPDFVQNTICVILTVALFRMHCSRGALSKLLKCEGGAGAEGAILPYVGHLLLISTLKIGADCCQLCRYKLTKPNQT